jgi:proline dehydrogenase
LVSLATGVLLLRGEQWLRAVLIYLSQAEWAQRIVMRNPIARQAASRFIAGETIDDAIAAARHLNDAGMSVTMDYLGESVHDASVAEAAREQIASLITAIHEHGVDANVSVKLTQLGIAIDEDLAYRNLHALLELAGSYGNRLRVDMEDSPWIDATLCLYRRLRDEDGLENVGVVIQSYLYRSEADVRCLVEEGAWVRLVKGAYLEPADVAFANKQETDAMFVHLMQMLLGQEARRRGVQLAIASHDERMIRATIDYAEKHQIPPDAYEFQMLYGVRRERQRSLVEQGYQMRVYVPFGTHWYPYFTRRLAERPANLWFFVSNLFR